MTDLEFGLLCCLQFVILIQAAYACDFVRTRGLKKKKNNASSFRLDRRTDLECGIVCFNCLLLYHVRTIRDAQLDSSSPRHLVPIVIMLNFSATIY